jgi:serine/threonine protein phosphatase PrpC
MNNNWEIIRINLGDGIFEKMENQEVIKSLISNDFQQKDFHLYTKTCVDNMMKEVLMSKSMDNLTAVVISFKNLFNFYNESKTKGKLLII